MKKASRISIVMVTVCASACVMNQFEQLELGEPQSYRNLTLYPVYANEAFIKHRQYTGNYLTLKDAVDAGKVVVSEHIDPADENASAEVSTLFIENISADTVFILNGEVVTGGRQDRMVRTDVVLVPHSGKIDLAVYCVEANRWKGEEDVFSITTHSLPPNEIRKAALTLATQDEVWESVELKLDEAKVHSESSRALDVHLDAAYESKIKDYVQKLASVFHGESEVIGVVAISGDEMVGCDLFVTHALFEKHLPNLLQSYASQVEAGSSAALGRDNVGDHWRRIMIAMRKEGNFLKPSGATEKSSVHFSMAER